jgi:WD40 repeat protein
MLLERGFDECARICLTHSFPIKHVDAFASDWDCPPQEREFVQQYLDSTDYTAYDRLVQLCDALALPSGVALSADGRLVASGSVDGTVRLWDTSSGGPLATLQAHTGAVWSVALSTNGRLLATGGLDGMVRLWEVLRGDCWLRCRGTAARSTAWP